VDELPEVRAFDAWLGPCAEVDCVPGKGVVQPAARFRFEVECCARGSRLACSTATSEEHKLAYEQFRGVAVWRKGMDVRVPLTDLLAAAQPPK
jgi:hypothetical protein